MKHILIVAFIAITTILMVSCEKKDTIPAPKQESSQEPARPKNTSNPALRDGGEDDDGPIIMHKVKTSSSTPVQQATVQMVNGTDSLQLVTNADGECIFNLPSYGTWQLRINRQGFQPADTVINLADSFTVRTSILDQQ